MERDETLIQPGAASVTYGRYLKVHELLALQHPLSQPPQHDETLFIVIHQVYELWFKQILHELSAAEKAVQDGQLMAFGRIAKRMATIQSVLTHQVDVLETMTPVDFNTFRANLNPASGFQSFQFRELEYRLGLKNRDYLKFYRTEPESRAALERALERPTIYDHFLRQLAARGLPVPAEVLRRDVSQPYQSHEGVLAAILQVYQAADRYYDLYSTLEALIDLDEGLLLWRQRHVVMVERMIGSLKGTGGSSGVKYLTHTLARRFFPEIWEARNWLGGGLSSYGSAKTAGPRTDQDQ
jgi:tryptophan 2,3-dioxygenase